MADKSKDIYRILIIMVALILVFIGVIYFTGDSDTHDGPGISVPGSEFIGVCSHVTRTEKYDNEFAIHNEIFSLMKEMGATHVRTGFKWADVEAEKGIWNWEIQDTIVRDAKAKNIKFLAMIQKPPEWALREGTEFDLWAEDWLVFVEKLVDRYGDYITAWELWNEPNLASGKYWPPERLPDDYAEMVKRTAEVIKEKQPHSTVLLGGLATNQPSRPFELWEELFELGVLDYVDGVAYHPYNYPGHELFSFDARLRALISKYTPDNKELWITEFGSSSEESLRSPTASPEKQAEVIPATALAFWVDKGTKFFIFEFGDRKKSPPGNIYQHHGVVDSNLNKKPVFNALQWLSGKLVTYDYLSHEVFSDGTLIEAIDGGGKKVYFSWGETAANELKIKGLSAETYDEQVDISSIGNYYERVLFWK